MKACDLEEKTNHLQACVAIDLGARYTGTFSILHKSSRLPSKDDCRAATYVLPEDGGKMTYSQRNRTAVRHRIRGKKRFALARRMAMLIIREKLAAKSVTLTSSETRRLAEAVSSLLRRRMSSARARSCGPITATVRRSGCIARTAKRVKPPISRTPSARAWNRAENGEISPFCTATMSFRITLPPLSSVPVSPTASTRAVTSSPAPRSRICSPICG